MIETMTDDLINIKARLTALEARVDAAAPIPAVVMTDDQKKKAELQKEIDDINISAAKKMAEIMEVDRLAAEKAKAVAEAQATKAEADKAAADKAAADKVAADKAAAVRAVGGAPVATVTTQVDHTVTPNPGIVTQMGVQAANPIPNPVPRMTP